MVVDDFDIYGIGGSPIEDDAPLVVDADAVLAFSISAQVFETQPWRTKIQERRRRVKRGESNEGQTIARRETPHALAAEEPLGVLVRKGFNHRLETLIREAYIRLRIRTFVLVQLGGR